MAGGRREREKAKGMETELAQGGRLCACTCTERCNRMLTLRRTTATHHRRTRRTCRTHASCLGASFRCIGRPASGGIGTPVKKRFKDATCLATCRQGQTHSHSAPCISNLHDQKTVLSLTHLELLHLPIVFEHPDRCCKGSVMSQINRAGSVTFTFLIISLLSPSPFYYCDKLLMTISVSRSCGCAQTDKGDAYGHEYNAISPPLVAKVAHSPAV